MIQRQFNLKDIQKKQVNDMLSSKAESMVRYSKKKTGKYFNLTKQSQLAFVKASNVLLEPFSPVKRGQDQLAEKLIRMPHNPLGVQLNKKISTLFEFCRQRNIPFNENEQRYYKRAKDVNSDKAFSKVIGNFLDEIKLRHKLDEQEKRVR